MAATTSATLGYGVIAVQMVLYGLGLGLTSAPATEAIMGVVSRSRAGVGSAVNDATRLIGGTLGVAVLGSVYASSYGSRLAASTPPAVPGQVSALAQQSVGAAYAAAGGLARLGQRSGDRGRPRRRSSDCGYRPCGLGLPPRFRLRADGSCSSGPDVRARNS